MTSSRFLESLYIQCLPSSLATTRSTELFTPKGLPQRMHSAGSSCLMTRLMAVAARKSICGFRLITFSGHVALHSPHWTQASSAKRSVGRSGSSESAPVGQADTQERHSVQPSTFTSTVPNGAPAGSGTMSTGAGAAACSSRNASRITSRLRPVAANDAGFAVAARAGTARRVSPSASGSSVSIVATRAPLKPRPARIGSVNASVLCRPAISWRGLARTSILTAVAP